MDLSRSRQNLRRSSSHSACAAVEARARGLSVAAAALGLAVGSGCSEPTAAELPQALTYHRDIAPLVERYCAGCHTAGGIAPFVLSSYADLVRHAPVVRSAVERGTMPPWLPSSDSLPLLGSRALRPQDKEDLLRWLQGGLPEGDPKTPPRTDLPAPLMPVPLRPDLVLDPGRDYVPVNSREDDYHCFVFDPKLTADRFLVASDVEPGNQRIVHHVVAYEIPEADVPAIQAKNVDGLGYTCFGAPGTSSPPATLFGWAPGSPGSRMPQGTALRLHKGSLIVVQVHYNVLAGPGQTDRTTMRMELTDTPPQKELYTVPLARPKQLQIPAGAADAVQTIQVPMSAITSYFKLPSSRVTVYAHTPHMHLLGKRITTWLNDRLLVDLPRWDFHWQQGYQFQTPYTATGTDILKLECRYDNTSANQPVLDGAQQSPRDVTWGEGTRDEMCLNYLLLGAE